MARAELSEIPPDADRAAEFLQQARSFLRDGEQDGTSLAGAAVLYYQACLAAIDAVLTSAGRRVGAGEEAHIVRIEAGAALLGGGYTELFERLDEWRRQRHDASYAAVVPGLQR